MAKTEMPHLGHDKHLCYLNNLGFQISNPEEYKQLVREGKFMCKICGRVAASEKNVAPANARAMRGNTPSGVLTRNV